MKISLCTVPVEPEYKDLTPKASSDRDVLATVRSSGQLPIMPKIAIVSIIKWMERHGYGPETYDYYDIDMELPSDERLERYFREYQPTVVGLSAVVSTCYYQVRRISRIIRAACPDAWIVLGGSLTASANLVLRRTDVDVCIVGDGEIAWVDFLDYIKTHGRAWAHEDLAEIRGLAWLDEAGELRSTGYGPAIPSFEQPFPDYDILQAGLKDRPQDLSNYFREGLGVTEFRTDPRAFEPHRRPKVASLWSSKGCVARCTFCQRSTKGYRVSNIETLDEHLAMLATRFDVGFVHILDENFGSNVKYAYELARTMKKHDMLWMASGVRVSTFKFDDISFFKEHGCCSLKFGVETGSQKIMNVMEKNFTVERVFETLKHCADLDLNSPLAVMVGMPGETNETARATGRFLGRLSHMQGIEPKNQDFAVFYAMPLTGTPLYIYGQQIGLLGKEPEDEEKYLLSVSGTGAYKGNYINLNGAPLRDVVFWDWLVKLEASRTFFEMEREAPIDRTRFIYRAIVAHKYRQTTGKPMTMFEAISALSKQMRTGLKSKAFWLVDSILDQHIVYSRTFHRLPRWLAFGAVKAVVYTNSMMQFAIARMVGREFNLFQSRPKVAPLDVPAAPARVEIRSSLRSIVKLHEVSNPRQKSLTEQNQDVLAIGL